MSHWIFTEEHKEFKKSVQKFLEKEVSPYIEEWENNGEIDKAFLTQLAEMGYIGISLPEEYGDINTDIVTEAVFLEQLGKYGTGGIAAGISYHLMTLSYISSHGNDKQKSKYLKPSIRGEMIGALAFNEINNDLEGLKNTEVRAEQQKDDYVLNGTKEFVINGISADFLCITVITDYSKGLEGISSFIVDRETPGLKIKRKVKKLGWRGVDTADIEFDNVRVSRESMIGEVSKAYKYLKKSNQWFRVIHALLSIGLGKRTLEDTIRYSKERKQFGKTINHFQALQHKMADMAIELEKTRSLTYRSLYLLSEKQNAEIESSMSKAHAGEMIKVLTDSAMQVYGGMGYIMETPVQRYWRDARGISVIGESTEYLYKLIENTLKQNKRIEINS